ncbi:nuclear transport factor 2 family protein [Pseudonocardia xinjiangensis]|uniref:nuclear transport factor 2 family protein n=1 Tax=Pseudonocardia xinjiangensis TaxID=75289 RepID=UPI003D8F8A30
MSDLEQNKTTVLAYFLALGRNDISAMDALMTEDATWWIVPGTKFSGLHQKSEFLENISMLYATAAGDLEMEFRDITAEGDRVAIVAKGNLPMKDGRTYQSNYNFLVHMRDGKIANGKEFLDAIHVNEIFGAP